MTKKGYAGKIKNIGTQIVNAIFTKKANKSGKVKEGKDLRAKK